MSAAQVLSALNYAAFLRSEDGLLHPDGVLPAWFANLLEPGQEVTAAFPVLDAFLPECEMIWGGTYGLAQSDFWTETDRNGRDWHLRATGLQTGAGSYLLIEDAETAFQDRRALQQAAHEAELLGRRVQIAARAKGEFVTAINHEIRTPLNAILGFADLLAGTELNPEQSEYVELFQKAGNNLLTLLNESLDLSKVESGHITLEAIDFDLDDVLDRVSEIMGMRAHSKGVELACWAGANTPVARIGDPNRLRQILLNLVSNAIKFTEQGEVAVRITGGKPGELQFAVSDTGIGIPPDKLEVIFDDFEQAEVATTRKYGGTGLGLGIARRLVEVMGGKLKVESRVGEGSTFSFNLALPESSAISAAQSLDLHGSVVLIADAASANRALLRDTLEELGAAVTEDLNDASDLAIVDFWMLDQVHSRRIIPMLLTHRRTTDEKRCSELGLSTVLVKPVRRRDLIAKISEIREQTGPVGRKRDSVCLPALAGLHILIADDSPENLLLLKFYLRNTGCTIDTAENGKLAIDQFIRGVYGMVLIDVQMPVVDGYTAASRMREWERHSNRAATPLIALTASSESEERERGRAAGCNAVLTKPLRQQTLFDAIAEFARRGKPEPGDTSLAELVPWYLSSCRNELAAVSAALLCVDFEKIRVTGHNLRGTGAGYGFPGLSDIGADLETAGLDRDPIRVQAAVTKLSGYLDEVERTAAV